VDLALNREKPVVSLRDLAYSLYERRLAAKLGNQRVPRHIGVIMDGNRRWAKSVGEQIATGHQRGADRIHDLLEWCEEAGVDTVTLWLFSTDNFNRPADEVTDLLRIVEGSVRSLADTGRWRIHPLGALDVLPAEFAAHLKEIEEQTRDNPGILVNAAIGYGGRREIADAVRSLLTEHAGRGTTIEDLAQILDVEHITEHLYTRGQPDPDLVIRTSGEQRLSGFMLWQSAHSEFYFCEAYWPAFRKVDFLRALRDYANRHRRYGT
jgi:short-chain Z-isoprenyl diphosphate synthase